MQVREQEREEREFVDLKAGRVGRHHAGRLPEVELSERHAARYVGEAVPHLDNAVQVAQHRDKRHPGQPCPNGPPGRDAEFDATFGASRSFVLGSDEALAEEAPRASPVSGEEPSSAGLCQVVKQAERATDRQGEEQRDGQVVGDAHFYAGGLYEHAGDELAEVVVVEEPTREPRVERRHDGRPGDGVEVCEVHRLLAAPERVPQVGVGHAQPKEREERGEKHDFAYEQQRPAPSDELDNVVPPVGQNDPRNARENQGRQRNGAGRERDPLQAGQQPYQYADEQDADGLGEQEAPVRKRPHEPQRQRQRQQRQAFDHQ